MKKLSYAVAILVMMTANISQVHAKVTDPPLSPARCICDVVYWVGAARAMRH